MILLQYLRSRWVFVLILAYALVSVVLYFQFQLDIFPPCMYSKLFGKPCFGCGLTRATLQLMQLNFRAAWNYNPMVYLVMPSFLGLVVYDVWSWFKQHSKGSIS